MGCPTQIPDPSHLSRFREAQQLDSGLPLDKGDILERKLISAACIKDLVLVVVMIYPVEISTAKKTRNTQLHFVEMRENKDISDCSASGLYKMYEL